MDDTPLNLMLARAMLESVGCDGVYVDCGAAAVEYIQDMTPDQAPDIIFMDFCMPQMDGFETTRAIRALRPSIPIVGLTADTSDDHHRRGLEAGMVRVLTKPYQKDQIVAVCNELAGRISTATVFQR